MGAFGTDSFLARPRRKMFPADFVVKGMEMGTYFGSVLLPPPLSPPPPLHLQHVRELPEFASLTSLDRSKWTRCLLWHGRLPGLSGAGDSDPWASSFGDLAFRELRTVLGFLSC